MMRIVDQRHMGCFWRRP